MAPTSTPTPVNRNAGAHKALPPYRGIRHQVQQRNRELATLVEIFFRTGDFEALVTGGAAKSSGERVMVLAYLVANDFTGAARELASRWKMASPVDALAMPDRSNGRELAEALGWISPAERASGPRAATSRQMIDGAAPATDSRVMGRVRDDRALAPTRHIPPHVADAMTAGAMRDELQVALAEAATQFEHDANQLAPSKHASHLAAMAKRWRALIAKTETEAR